MTDLYLKLRNNIVLESDLQLAEREVKSIFNSCTPVSKDTAYQFSDLPTKHILSNSKPDGVIGYWVSGNRVPLTKVVRLLSFIQEIWGKGVFDDVPTDYKMTTGGYTCIIPLMAMSEFLFFTKNPDENTAKKIVSALALVEDGGGDVSKAIAKAKTSAAHIHSFHAYKAKFFPRFVRSLIVSNCDINKKSIRVCDAFVGSGTTLIEASLLGFPSVGIDIDALSCFISKVKQDALMLSSKEVRGLLSKDILCKEGDNHFTFPPLIYEKFKRWNGLDEMKSYQDEISYALNRIDQEKQPIKDLLKIALSDALTRKFNVRMMGTGSGRFALEIGKTDLSSIIKSDLQNEIKAVDTINTIKRLYHIQTAKATILKGNATKRNVEDNCFDVIITSPPYLPASSGREDYLIGKLISMKAMGLYDEADVENYQNNSVGSMKVQSDELSDLPNSITHLYNWLINDELRKIKAQPIVAYYHAIKEALKEDMRTIKKGGKIIYIIGKETIFYSSATKEVLYKVDCEKNFSEIAKSIGLKVIETINIELDKKNNIARPRGLDKYYECAIIMEK